MKVNTIKVVSNKCFGAIEECAQCEDGVPDKTRRVVIYVKELESTIVSRKLMDEVTGLMKKFGILHARYQRKSNRFFGVVSDKAIADFKTLI